MCIRDREKKASFAEQSGGGMSRSMTVTSNPLRSSASPVNMPHIPDPTIVTVGFRSFSIAIGFVFIERL